MSIISNDSYTVGDHVVVARCLHTEDCVNQYFYVAPCAMKIVQVDYVHGNANDDNLNLQVRRCTGKQNKTQGALLLTNDNSAGFLCNEPSDVLQRGIFTTNTSLLVLSAGDRLSLSFWGVLDTLADVVVTVVLQRV